MKTDVPAITPKTQFTAKLSTILLAVITLAGAEAQYLHNEAKRDQQMQDLKAMLMQWRSDCFTEKQMQRWLFSQETANRTANPSIIWTELPEKQIQQ